MKLRGEDSKSLDLLRVFKRMEQERKVLHVEKDFLHKSTAYVISNASAERHRGLNFTDTVISSVENGFVGLVMKVIRALLPWL